MNCSDKGQSGGVTSEGKGEGEGAYRGGRWIRDVRRLFARRKHLNAAKRPPKRPRQTQNRLQTDPEGPLRWGRSGQDITPTLDAVPKPWMAHRAE